MNLEDHLNKEAREIEHTESFSSNTLSEIDSKAEIAYLDTKKQAISEAFIRIGTIRRKGP